MTPTAAAAATEVAHSSGAIELVFALLAAATGLAMLANRIKIPYPVLLLLGGLVLGFIPGLPPITLEPDIVFLLFLPPILFGAGYFTSIRDFKSNLRAIGLLAFGLVIVTTCAVAVVAQAIIPGLGWAPAFALGAIVAPPDAVAATAIFRRLGVPRRIVTILEGESLVNDATALVAYRFAIVAWASGNFSLGQATATFVLVAIGGLVIGLVGGVIVSRILTRVMDPVFAVVVTFLAPIAVYLPAEYLQVSGVLAAVVAGIYVGRHAPVSLDSSARIAGVASWQVLLFLINGLVFILIGLQLRSLLTALEGHPLPELLGLAAAISLTAILVRIVWVFPATYLPRLLIHKIRAREGMPARRNVFVVSWAGMRGVVSLAAALALPTAFPQRDLLIFLTFSVIIVTLVGQGLTLPLLVRALRIGDEGQDQVREEAQGRIAAAAAAVARLDELEKEWPGHLELIDTLRIQYRHRVQHAELTHDGATESDAERELLEHRRIRQAVIEAERAAIARLRDDGEITDEIFRRIERDLDLEELRMEA